MKTPDRLEKDQINRRLQKIKSFSAHTQIRSGWIQYIRRALGMTLSQLAKRVGLSTSTIAHLERAEVSGVASVKSIKKIAAAMECDFVYAVIPKNDLEEILRRAARKKARQLLAAADTHMDLENQKVHEDLEERISRLAENLIQKGDVW
jgi:predicted DNA-binding mobile mystery protein A